MLSRGQRLFAIGTIALLLLNLLQGAFTALLDDEAYYWMYSQHLAWGYFDHPPMVALMIRAGYSIFHNTLGVRLFSILSTCGAILIMYRLVDGGHPVRLIAIVLSIAFIQLGGFLAVPDVALVFFSTVFLWSFKHFLKHQTWKETLLLGVCMAALLYSKYQGLLLILFCLFANLRLLKSAYFWFATLVGVILFLPHLYWQYRHGFPPMQYFLADQYSKNNYEFHFITDYIGGQLLVFGPLIGWMIFLATFSGKLDQDAWIRTLKIVVLGVIGFFLLASFKGVVEPNWTAVAIVPAILLLHKYLDKAPRLERALYWLCPISVALIMVVRVAFVTDLVGDRVELNKEIHDPLKWTSFVKKKAGPYPVVFVNSYQRASKYYYYQHRPASSFNGLDYRNNQYDIWLFDKSWTDDSILVVTMWKLKDESDSLDCYQGRLFTAMFRNPNNAQTDLFGKLKPRKKLVPFFSHGKSN